jgi:hypothetical protein
MAIYNYKNKFIKLPVYGWTVEVVLADYPPQVRPTEEELWRKGSSGGNDFSNLPLPRLRYEDYYHIEAPRLCGCNRP